MPRVPFEGLPDDARLWIFAAERPLVPGERDAVLGDVDRFLDTWSAHGTPLRCARDFRHERFLLVAVDERAAGVSGCSIDALTRQLREHERKLGITLLDTGPRRRFVTLGDGTIYYHLTYVEDLAEGFRLCGTVPAAAGRTYILAGPEVTTLNELVRLTAEVAGVPPPRVHLPVWPFWLAGAACEAVCAPLRIEPPLYRRRVDFFTKSRAFDISRARQELGYAPAVGLRDGIGRTIAWYRQEGWL